MCCAPKRKSSATEISRQMYATPIQSRRNFVWNFTFMAGGFWLLNFCLRVQIYFVNIQKHSQWNCSMFSCVRDTVCLKLWIISGSSMSHICILPYGKFWINEDYEFIQCTFKLYNACVVCSSYILADSIDASVSSFTLHSHRMYYRPSTNYRWQSFFRSHSCSLVLYERFRRGSIKCNLVCVSRKP